MKNLTASDKLALVRLASSLTVGSPERRAILAGLSREADFSGDVWLLVNDIEVVGPRYSGIVPEGTSFKVLVTGTIYSEEDPDGGQGFELKETYRVLPQSPGGAYQLSVSIHPNDISVSGRGPFEKQDVYDHWLHSSSGASHKDVKTSIREYYGLQDKDKLIVR